MKSILFLLASLGVINGFLVGGYLIAKRPRVPAEVYFGGLLLALCLRIGKSVIFHFSEEVDLLILQIGLSACVFIGPLFYLYTKNHHRASPTLLRADGILLLGILAAILAIGIPYPYRQRPDLWNEYFIYGIYGIWLVFTLAGLWYWSATLRGVLTKPRSMTTEQQYLAAVGIAQVFITATYFTALFGLGTYLWGSLIFTLTFYYLAIRALILRKPVTPKASPPPLSDAARQLTRLHALMEQEQLYLQAGFKLEDLAGAADISRHTASRILNEEYQLGFAHFVSSYRVQEARRLIRERPELSLEGIGYEAGFRSKSSFYEAFKKIAHCTPAAYRKEGGCANGVIG